MHRGEANIYLKNYKEAYEDLKMANKHHPTHISTLNNLAIAASETQNSDASIGYLEKTLQIFPKYDASLFNRVNVYYRNKSYEKAYISILKCGTQTTRPDYGDFMRVLKEQVNKK